MEVCPSIFFFFAKKFAEPAISVEFNPELLLIATVNHYGEGKHEHGKCCDGSRGTFKLCLGT